MTIVIIVIAVLAVIVLALVLTPVGRAIRTHPDELKASRPYQRPAPAEGGAGTDSEAAPREPAPREGPEA
jgi:hypothetical protein